ncbi:uncharacterized protein VTP21DRAFT_10417 [Calcarisporiella thermophila]|uniref:uncharacterized protein n=1 Tax=Calcarisporiella thermophila TaxID=911321 RepID=UPI003743593E
MQRHDEICKTLYVGNLDPRVTDVMLHQIFSTVGPIENVKIIPDKNFSHGGLNYGFVEYHDHRTAEQALQTLNGRKIFNMEIKVNWGYSTQSSSRKEDTTSHHHIFVGDLSPEVTDEVLSKAFSAFGSMSEARIMWDPNTGKSRGYGFVSFREKSDAEHAISTMNGEWLGSRAIRCNWANQKTQPERTSHAVVNSSVPLTYESVVTQTPQYNTTVYIGNLSPTTTQEHVIPFFQSFGYVVDIRVQAERGFGFVKMDTHENAAMAIVQLQGSVINGRPAKLSWGKDRPPNAHYSTTGMYTMHGAYTTYPTYPAQYTGQQQYTMAGPEYELPPGMNAPPPSVASIDTAATAVNPTGYDPNAAVAAYGQYYAAGYGASYENASPHGTRASPTYR